MSERTSRLISEIAEILEEASGIEMSGADPNAAFVELGLDSLFLTQVALTFTKKYGVKVTFRQLNEDLSSLQSLAAYIDGQMPASAEPAAVVPAAVQATSNVSTPVTAAPVAGMTMPSLPQMSFPIPAAAGANAGLESLISSQLQLMQQQLMMLTGMPAPMPASTAATPTVSSLAAPSASTPKAAPTPVTVARGQEEISAEEQKELKKPFGAIARIEKASSQFSEKQQRWLEHFIKAYTEKTATSKTYTQKYRKPLADPRVVTGFKPHLKELIYQPVVHRSLGSRVWDLDNNEYIDILNGFGSNMFGHNPPFIVNALREQLENGYELGPQHNLAGEVAELICEFTGFDRAGLCNTGSEAVLGCMRIARTITGRNIIVSFNGAYHGILDEVIVRGTKKHKTVPAAAGIMANAVQNMLVLDYGTPEALAVIRERADEIAGILVEPIQSRRADFQPKEFLQELRHICDQTGALLIFDEVITGFRLRMGGSQEYFNIRADLGAYGKVVGGGMPIGVIAGKRDYMDALDGGYWQYGDNSVPEVGVTYFAGTFVRHPFALATAKASLLHMKEKGPALQQRCNELTEWIVKEINAFTEKTETPFHLVYMGSLFKPKYDADMPNADLLYFLMRYKGIHIYDGFPCFLTESHSREDCETIVRVFKESLFEMIEAGFMPGTVSPGMLATTYTNGNGNGYTNGKGSSSGTPPVPGALMGKNPDGSSGWFLPDPERPGKYLKVTAN